MSKSETTILLYGVPNDLLLRLARDRALLVPTHISWRRAHAIVQRGWATLYPFHRRWQGRIDITPAGQEALHV